MTEIHVEDIRVAESPIGGETVVHELRSGDRFYVQSTEPVKLGGVYRHSNAIVTRIYYEPKKWWQFWKKKKQLGFEVMWK